MQSRVLPHAARPSRAARRTLRLVAVRALLLAAVSGAVLVAPSARQAPSDAVPVATTTSDVTIVQANIYTRLTVPRFQADVRKVLEGSPDFVTYNEVPFRSDEVLAPEGYAIYRDMADRFTSATPVAWRTDRWSLVDSGTFRLSNWRGKPPGRVVELGRRYANWVTLNDAEGRVVSVVSAHVAPAVRGMPDLRRHSVSRLRTLVDTLAPSGPVLVGGDFNIHYRSGIYPRDVLTEAGLVPTYDTMNAYFPTGDHQGMTIDYVFNRGEGQLLADKQYPVELKSDHDAVVAGLSWQVDPPGEIRTVVNNPAGEKVDQRAVLRELVAALHGAAPGSVVRIATTRFDLSTLMRSVRSAMARGVQVRVTVNGAYPTRRERRLERAILADGGAGSWFRRCDTTCAQSWSRLKLPKTLVMVTDADGVWTQRYDVSRMLTPFVWSFRTKVTAYTGIHGLARGDQMVRGIG